MLWAYVHGETDEKERAALERLLAKDEAFKSDLADVRGMDRKLRTLMPLMTWDEQKLEDCILEALDRNMSASGEAVRPASRPATGLPFSRWTVALLAAAAVLLVVALWYPRDRAVRWAEPEVVPMLFRGADPEATRLETQARAAACFAAVRQAVDANLKRRGVSGRDWTLAFRFKQLPKGAFSIQIKAYSRGRFVREWTEYCRSTETLLSRVDQFGDRVAAGLAEAGR
jgi:hypothetical protein